MHTPLYWRGSFYNPMDTTNGAFPEDRDLLIAGLQAEGIPITPEEIVELDIAVNELADILTDYVLWKREVRGPRCDHVALLRKIAEEKKRNV